MARISTYPIDSTPTVEDIVIGTEVDNLDVTKNYRIGDILALSGGGTGTVTDIALSDGSKPGTSITTSGVFTFLGTGGITTDVSGTTMTIDGSGAGGGSGTVTSITNAADLGTGTAITEIGTFTYSGSGLISTAVTGTTVTISTAATNNIGTVTSVAATHAGTAFTATVTNPTGAASIAINTNGGTVNDYINGLGDLVALSTLPSAGVTQIVAGTNVTVSPVGGTGTVTINSTDQFTGTVIGVTGALPITSSGGTTPVIGINDYTGANGTTASCC